MIKKLLLVGLSLCLLSGCSAGISLLRQSSATGSKVVSASPGTLGIHFGNPAPIIPKRDRIAFPDRRDENNPVNNHAVELKGTWHF